MFDTCFDRKHHACFERMFRVSCVVIEFIVVLQTRSLMADQTHSVYHKAKALAEFHTAPLSGALLRRLLAQADREQLRYASDLERIEFLGEVPASTESAF